MMKIKNIIITILILLLLMSSKSSYKIALLKYNGGGDWYSNPTSLKNLIKFSNSNLNLNINPEYDIVEPSSTKLFNYPYIYMTGHGNVYFSDIECENIKKYLLGGGFLHIDDNYGLDKYIRKEIKKIFPLNDLIEIPNSHEIYNQIYKFEDGLPKIHEHNNKPPKGYGIFIDNRLVCYYSFESDLGDGWENREVHNNSENIRILALKMGCNILSYAFTH